MAEDGSIAPVRDHLLRERRALLDLSTRNRLLNTPVGPTRARTVEIVGASAEAVFADLLRGRSLSFQPVREGAEGDAVDPAPETAPRVDRLQTRLTAEALQKRLLDVWYDAASFEEEQGVNILYLAVGLLRWFDDDKTETPRHAPLVLLPVELERASAADRFRLRVRPEPPSPNLTLQAKLKAEFGLELQDFADEDEVDLAAYFAHAEAVISGMPRWEVLPDALVLGFFSFAKFLMYRDLDPDTWPAEDRLDRRRLIAALLQNGFETSEPLIADEAGPIDGALPPVAQSHVLDADSSQTVAIAEAVRGRDLVIKGPPGTGKSQTITNIIASAVAEGRTVLFVAEKMAALDVVHRRLQQVGLGPLALELHSHKANKKSLLAELARTRDAGRAGETDGATLLSALESASGQLNAFAERLHAPLSPSGLTPYAVLGELMALQASGAPTGYAPAEGAEWDAAAIAERRVLVGDLADQLRRLGVAPGDHPWRGVNREAMDPGERERLSRRLAEGATHLATADAEAAVVATALGLPPPRTLGDLQTASGAGEGALSLPIDADRAALAHPLWRSSPAALRRLAAAGAARATTRAACENQLVEAAWSGDWAAIRDAVAVHGNSLWRLFNGEYRRRVALLRSYVRGKTPKGQAARLALIDKALAARAAQAEFDAARSASPAFGEAWRDTDSDWAALARWSVWRDALPAGLPSAYFERLSEGLPPPELAAAMARLAPALAGLMGQIEALGAELRLDLREAFGAETWRDAPASALAERLALWRSAEEAITRYIAYASKRRLTAAAGLAALAQGAHDGALAADQLGDAFERAHLEAVRDRLFAEWPDLRAFDGVDQERLRAAFRTADLAAIGHTRRSIAATHARGLPSGEGGVGALGVLNGEIAKKRRHLPIRTLLERAGPAIQRLKPVFLMSPLSVAQFLKPGALAFDLLVIDEASQVEPVDALGAVARCDQIVVVGDERQLPPTRFFAKLTSDLDDPEETDEDEAAPLRAADVESILDLCLAKGAPYRMLNWHYRSRHQSLIAVSNREFYEDRLSIIPSPFASSEGVGLSLRHLPHTAYDRGGTRTNPEEARAVAEAVIDHARRRPDQSLGVATFSTAQRQAVMRALERLRRDNPDLETFFASDGPEPFFVKNLETIQGDERDVIFISVGYGKTREGYLSHSFGPLNGEGGERRLNVLISRAKVRCEVFANFTGEDVDLARSGARGVAALKTFLTFAQTGGFGQGTASGRGFDSPFEALIARRLDAMGCQVEAQIGAAGFFVDLAVVDPDRPGRYLLGIECDGAQYHQARSARDRDRLRQQVLEAQGWIIHRIWSADWFMRPEEEAAKLKAALEGARLEWARRDAEGVEIAPPAPPVELEPAPPATTEATPVPPRPGPAVYVEADIAADTAREPHQTPVTQMADLVAKIVAVEGPIHVDEVATRIRTFWGLQRAGARIRAAVEAAAGLARDQGVIEGETFLAMPGAAVAPRDRSLAASASLRKPELLPPQEVEAALLVVVDANFGVAADEMFTSAARLFGFKSTSAQLRAVLAEGLSRLEAAGRLALRQGLYVRA